MKPITRQQIVQMLALTFLVPALWIVWFAFDSTKLGFGPAHSVSMAAIGLVFLVLAAFVFVAPSRFAASSLFFWSVQVAAFFLAISPLGLSHLWPEDYGAIAVVVVAATACFMVSDLDRLTWARAGLAGFDTSVATVLGVVALSAALTPLDETRMGVRSAASLAASATGVAACFGVAAFAIVRTRPWWWAPQLIGLGILAYIVVGVWSFIRELGNQAA